MNKCVKCWKFVVSGFKSVMKKCWSAFWSFVIKGLNFLAGVALGLWAWSVWLFNDFWELHDLFKPVPTRRKSRSGGASEGGAAGSRDSGKDGAKEGDSDAEDEDSDEEPFDMEAEDEYDAVLGEMWKDTKRWVANHPEMTYEEKLLCLGYIPPGHKKPDWKDNPFDFKVFICWASFATIALFVGIFSWTYWIFFASLVVVAITIPLGYWCGLMNGREFLFLCVCAVLFLLFVLWARNYSDR